MTPQVDAQQELEKPGPARILWLHEGNPFRGTRGGDVYWQHLTTHLRNSVDVVAVNWAALGLTSRVSGQEYAERVAAYMKPLGWRAPILHDGSSYYWMYETNRLLRREGFGPIVSFM